MLFNFLRDRPSIDINERSQYYPAIEVSNLRKTFKKRVKGENSRKRENRTITAIDDLSFTVSRGSIMGLLGPNSSGKTTTLRCMSTLANPDSGSISYFGIDAIKEEQIARNILGYVAQSAGVDKTLTGREHLDLFADLAHVPGKEKKATISSLIDLLDLGDFIDRLTGVYSGGVIRRLDLAIALLHRPPVLILDEPTVGLDIETRRVIWDVLRNWRDQGGTVVLSSHYLEEVDVLSDQVCILEKGLLIASGTPTQLKNNLGGDRVTVRIDEFTDMAKANAACNTLRERGLVRDGIVNRLQNNSIELVVDPENANIGGDIVKALEFMGHDRLFSFSQSKPSLDDVYLAATGKSLMDADQSARSTRSEKIMKKESMGMI